MEFPKDIKYTKDHEWIRIEKEIGVVGITDYAQGELGDIVFVDLPAAGKKVRQGESMGTIEAVKAVSDIYAPVSGEVSEINADLGSGSELVNKDPYGKGWMIKMKLTNPVELKSLLDDSAYRALVGK